LDEKPPDLTESVTFRGEGRGYAQIRYGSPGSVRVAVVLDRISSNEFDLYVDADRDRDIEPGERVPRDGDIWRVPLDVVIEEDERDRYIARELLLRATFGGRGLAVASAGFVEGTSDLGGEAVAVRRMDGDANGSLTDAQDRLWIDLDRDGSWDPLSEQFLFAPILELNGKRHVVRSSAFGSRVTFEELTGSGSVRIAFTGCAAGSEVRDVALVLVGRDGTAVGIREAGRETPVPSGAYRVSVVTLTLDEPSTGPPWGYVFAESGDPVPPVWHDVGDGTSVEIEPIGRLDLTLPIPAGGLEVPPGGQLTVEPRLVTEDGLLLMNCYRGTGMASYAGDRPQVRCTLIGANGKILATASSGFG